MEVGQMSELYSKQSQEQYLSITLRDLGIDETAPYGLGDAKKYKDLFVELTTFSPTSQSHLGVKFDSYSKLNSRNLNSFLAQVFSGLKVKKVYLYETFSVKKEKPNRVDLFQEVSTDKGAMICLRCCNSVKQSLYMSVRNAIAHGNIIYNGYFYILYSVSDDKKEYDSPVTFFLRIKSLGYLRSFTKVLEYYR